METFKHIYNIELLNNQISQHEKLSISPNTDVTDYKNIEEKNIYNIEPNTHLKDYKKI